MDARQLIEINSNYDNDNIFAKIIDGRIPCNIIYEDEFLISFHDINPLAEVHALVIPKEKFISFDDFMEKAHPHDVHHFFLTIKKIAVLLKISEKGYKLITNHGVFQEIPHFHMHLIGGLIKHC